MKFVHALFLMLAVSFAAVPTVGCTAAQGQQVLSTITTLVQDAEVILETIDAAATVFFIAHPNPTLQAQYEADLAKCEAALTTASRAAQGVAALTQDQIDAAFVDFKAAYAALTSLLQSGGIMSAPNTMAAAPGQAPVQVQTPLVMLKK